MKYIKTFESLSSELSRYEKAEKMWQFFSTDGRRELIGHAIDGYDGNEHSDKICNTDWNDLDRVYQKAVEESVPYRYDQLSKQEDWIHYFNN
jgi:hypothetical protein